MLVSGEWRGRPVAGVGYLEMTGYTERFAIGRGREGAKPLAEGRRQPRRVPPGRAPVATGRESACHFAAPPLR